MIRYVLFRSERLFYSQLTEHMRKSFKESEGKFCIISIGENTLSVEYSDIYHVLSNLFP